VFFLEGCAEPIDVCFEMKGGLMEPITAETAEEHLRRLIEGEPLEPSLPAADSVPWEEKRLLSWSEFLAILVSYCRARQWEILFDSVSDFSLAIFAREEQVTNGIGMSHEAIQKPLPFGEDTDGLPF
jgi:hypothetical protein